MAEPLALKRPFAPLQRVARVPRDLEAATTRGEEIDPAEAGIDEAAREGIWAAAQRLYRTGLHPALQICVRCDERPVLHRALGFARGNDPEDPPEAPKQRADLETSFVLYSASKAVTALLVLKLDELGVLHIEDRVAEYIPEFAANGKRGVTLRHVLAHRAGIPRMPEGADFLEDYDSALHALCAAKPESRPGRRLSYHAVSGGYVLGEVIRRATGDSPRAALRKYLAEPLRCVGLGYGTHPARLDEVALDAFTGPPVVPPFSWLMERALGDDIPGIVATGNSDAFRTGIVPAGNVICSADELSRFYSALAQEGRFGGTQVFEPRTIRRATSEQSYYELDTTLGAPLRWGLGVILGGPVSLFGWDTRRALGHLGFTNILGWADPDRGLGVAILNSGKPFAGPGALPLAELVLRISRAFPKRTREA